MHDSPWRHLPYPELVEPEADQRDYEIHDSRHIRHAPSLGMVNQVDRVMLVPLAEEGGSVIRHELAHVRWSPKKLPKVGFDHLILLAVEDARINLALQRRQLACADATVIRDYAMRLAHRDLVEKAYGVFALRCIASLGTDMTDPLLASLQLEAPGMHATAERLVAMVEGRLDASRRRTGEGEIATVREAVRTARRVAAELQRNCIPIEKSGRYRLLVEGGFCISCEGHAGDADPDSRLRRITGGAEDRESAEMHVLEAALPIPLTTRGRRPSRRRARREGAIVRSANRWYTDRAIFRGRTRSLGGTVLIDTSSSMRLTAADVDQIVKGAPAATLVAIYSGHQREGQLRIVAREGRRAAPQDLSPYGNGNLIDLPALEWLARQPGPRVWLSDARVTGVNDYASRIIARRCRMVCLRHRIVRAENATQAAAILEGRCLRRLPLMVL